MKISPKDQELLKKLHALSTQGVEGERENAKSMFLSMCERLRVDPQNFEPEPKKLYWIPYKKKFKGKEFAMQVVSSVIGHFEYREYNNKIGIELSAAEHSELVQRLNFYYPKFLKDVEVYYTAWIHKNKLYVKPDPNAKGRDRELTPEEIMRIRQLMALADNIDTHKFHLQLNK